MRLGAFVGEDGDRPCAITGDEVIELPVADPGLPADIASILALGESGLEAVQAAIDSGRGRRALGEVSLTAPVRPQKFFGIGLNYADHAAEANRQPTEFPTVFAKMINCVTGPYDAIERPAISEQLDYEGELAIVIGRRCRHVAREDAPGAVGGYTITNDVSVRDWQRKTQQWTLGKSFDTHGPLGPWIVTPDELGDPHDLEFRTLVNGEVRQRSSTSNLIHDCWDLIADISTACTLEPGDVIATGTCSGVAAFFTPPRWLQDGDVVRIEFERIGAIENPVVREPARVAVAA
jgi:2-keto-4-pentenoate hydratase/2-oxohepta-3-ene-1,7-dioic acid hydratase in catechol pathway